jgi:hypothetical protein
LRGKITKKRGTSTSCLTPNTNPTKKHLKNLPTKIHQKGLQKSPKNKNEIHKKIQSGTRMNSKPSIHEEERFFTKRLATFHACMNGIS